MTCVLCCGGGRTPPPATCAFLSRQAWVGGLMGVRNVARFEPQQPATYARPGILMDVRAFVAGCRS